MGLFKTDDEKKKDLNQEGVQAYDKGELEKAIKAFQAAHPAVDIRVEYRRSWEIYGAVLRGDVDIGLTFTSEIITEPGVGYRLRTA